uniref:Uncharacterized protein MANES_09G169100 n=1 Tax=Rhizophora mucronata TaxID=61149 RepID=A0A2P2J6A2_RHIMU
MSITGSEMKLDALEYQPGSSSSSIFTNRRIASVEAMFPSACQLFHLLCSTAFQALGFGALQGPTIAC